MTTELDKLEQEVLKKVILKARDDFYSFVKLLAPTILPERFRDGVHIELICKELQAVYESVVNPCIQPIRLQLWLPPGSMKSKLASNLFPAWCLGKQPQWCFLAIGSDFEFAIDNFGRPTKELVDSPQYKAVFPMTNLKRDVQSAGRWDTTKKGRFVARGAGQNIAGRRAHIAIVDDAITEQTSDATRKDINNWYRKGLRTRLLPRGAEIIINTRWFVEDLSGYMIKVDAKSQRPWRVVKIPAILDAQASEMLRKLVPANDKRFMPDTSFWPEFWPTEKLLEIKETSLPTDWAALYMQTPIVTEGGVIKRNLFKLWELTEPPKCSTVIISLDTALSQTEYANYSAYTVWGIFQNIVEVSEGTPIAQDSMILLAAGKQRWNFNELCQKSKELNDKYQPDFFLVEETSAGILLIPELHKRSIPVLPFKPHGDKTARLQATTPYFYAGRIWIPAGKIWAEEVMAEVTSFQPHLKNQQDDYTDTLSQAVIWLRDNFKIDNDGYSNRWDADVVKQRPKTYWSSALSG